MRNRAAVLSVVGAVALAAFGPSVSASAAVFSPAPASTDFTGTLNIQEGGFGSVDCAVTMKANVARGGRHAEIWSVAFNAGSWQCGVFVTPLSLPWYLYPDTTTQVTITPISIQAIIGSCTGSLVASWSNSSPQTMTISSAVLPGTSGNCTITGVLTSSTSLTII